MTAVDRAAWHAELASLRAMGYSYLDFLTGVDRLDHVEVLAHVVAPDGLGRRRAATQIPISDARLASISDLYPAAAWHERETAEMFGIGFDGHPDPRRLLLRHESPVPPLRKACALRARVETPWPGAVDTEGGRRPRRAQLPPGVQASWMPEGGR